MGGTTAQRGGSRRTTPATAARGRRLRRRAHARARTSGARAAYGAAGLAGLGEPLSYGASVAATLLLVLRNVRVPAEKVAPSVQEILRLQRKHRGQGLRAFVEEQQGAPSRAGPGPGTAHGAAAAAGDGAPGVRARAFLRKFRIRGAQGWRETLLALRCAREVASSDAFIVSSSSSAHSVSPLSLLSRVPTIVMDKVRYEPSALEPILGPDESCLPDVPSVRYGRVVDEAKTPVLSLEWRRAVAKLCDGAVPGFGLTLLARPEGAEQRRPEGAAPAPAPAPAGEEEEELRLGVATLRVKRLPPNELRVESELRRSVATHFRGKFHEYFGESLAGAGDEGADGADAGAPDVRSLLDDEYFMGQALAPEMGKIRIPPGSAFRNVGYITWLGVTPNCRGSGVGRLLLQWMEKKVAAWGLDIIALHCHAKNGARGSPSPANARVRRRPTSRRAGRGASALSSRLTPRSPRAPSPRPHARQ